MPTVQGDKVSLVQLFQNLIGNAMKFRGEDAPVVSISAAPTDHTWRISVHDNGIGIDPAFHREIFAPLRRLHRPGRSEGHGLGLAICRKIIDRHRGRIWVDSTPGQGTTFSFTLPGAKPTLYRVL
jgi:chemotaxis family two-component system sensor kinase Cph1